jgi:Pyruvate/2-oxoacid:ferredoxin oxidoreductase gamma subunit
MSQNILNWMSYLNAEKAQRNAAAAVPAAEKQDPAQKIIEKAVKDNMVALTDVLKLTGLQPDDAVKIIEDMRAKQLVEIVTFDESPAKFLRLTSLGYASQDTPLA